MSTHFLKQAGGAETHLLLLIINRWKTNLVTQLILYCNDIQMQISQKFYSSLFPFVRVSFFFHIICVVVCASKGVSLKLELSSGNQPIYTEC